MNQTNRFKQFVAAPVFEDEDMTRVASLQNVILLALAGSSALFTALSALVRSSQPSGLIIGAFTAVLTLGMWFFMRRGYVRQISILLSTAFLVIVTMSTLLAGSVRDPIAAAYVVCIVIAGLLISLRAALVFTGLSILAYVGLIQLELLGTMTPVLEPPGAPELVTFAAVMITFVAFLIVALRGTRNAYELARSNERALSVANDELVAARASLEQLVVARTEELRASAEVGRVATSILDPEHLLREVVRVIATRFDFNHAAAFTVDRTGKYAVLRAATGAVGEALLRRGLKIKIDGSSMVGFAMSHRRPRVSLDVSEEEVYAEPRLPETQSEIALPLIVGDKVLGALDVQSGREDAFDQATLAVLQAMSDQIAIALDNANSYAATQEAIQQARGLYNAAEEVGRLEVDLEDKVEAMMRAAGETIGFDRWWVVVFDARREWLIPIAANQGKTGRDHAIRIAEQQSSPVVRSAVYGESYVVNDPENDSRLQDVPSNRRMNIGKFIAVPILTSNQPLGALTFGRSLEGRELTEGELRVGQSLASLTAIAIENQRLFDETQRVLEEVDTINRHLTGEAWTSALRRSHLNETIHVSSKDTQEYEQIPQLNEAMTSRETIVHQRSDTEADVVVPLMLRGVPIGTLHVRTPTDTWDDDMVTTISRIADHVAQSAENARLIEETEVRFARERALHESTDKIRRHAEVERILQTAAEELSRHLNTSRVAVRLSSKDTGTNGYDQDDGQQVD